jgi:hypothetical protein
VIFPSYIVPLFSFSSKLLRKSGVIVTTAAVILSAIFDTVVANGGTHTASFYPLIRKYSRGVKLDEHGGQ